MGGKSSTDTSSTSATQSQTGPWSVQAPYLAYAFSQAKQLYDKGPMTYYPGQTVAAPSTNTLAYQNATVQRALNGSPLVSSADNNLQSVLNGDYLSAGNPYFQSMVSQLGQSLQPQISSGFEAAGRYGSGAQAAAFADALTKQAGQLAYQNYNTERQNQQNDLSLAPTLANQDYVDLGQLGQIGSAQDQHSQALINEAVDRYNFNQQAPYNNLANLLKAVQGNYGSTGSQTTTQTGNNTTYSLGGGSGSGSGSGSSSMFDTALKAAPTILSFLGK